MADDFVVLVHGTQSDANALRGELADLLAGKLRMALSAEKTLVTHIDTGFEFLAISAPRFPLDAEAGRWCSRTRPRQPWRW
jgi:RNA-directed DNA polymerase